MKNTHPESFEIPKTSSKTVYVTPGASLYSDAANCLSGDVAFGITLVGVMTSSSHKELSRRLNVVRLMRIFCENFSSLFFGFRAPSIALFWHFGLEWVHEALDFYAPKLPLLEYDVLIIFFPMKWVAPSNKFSWKKAHFLFLCPYVKKNKNHPCFSLMQLHTIFDMKMQCNVFLPHVLLTRRQFQRLKYSVCPSVYTDDLIFTRKNWLIIATCCLYCRTNRLRQTNRLRRLVRLSINTAILYQWLGNEHNDHKGKEPLANIFY